MAPPGSVLCVWWVSTKHNHKERSGKKAERVGESGREWWIVGESGGGEWGRIGIYKASP